jgi:hypothetical protein
MLWIRAVVWGALLAACATPASTVSAPSNDSEVAPPAKPQTDHPSQSGLRIKVDPADAVVLVDGKWLGPANAVHCANAVVPLGPGLYQVALRRAGYQTWRAEVSVKDTAELIEVSLARESR